MNIVRGLQIDATKPFDVALGELVKHYVDANRIPNEHTYPSNYGPGVHWAFDMAWECLDVLTPGVLSPEARALVAGMITAKLLMVERRNEQH